MKRFFDFFTALFALILLSPALAIVAWQIRRKLGSPVFFRQLRPGLHGKPFEMIKFRTMTDERGPDGELLSNEKRFTSFGGFLRSTSLDELPELWNVLKGDMSLVGPRPLRMDYLPLYSARQARRHEVRPGITGWAQVNGRNAITWEEKFDLDIWYVDNRNLLLDLKVLALTVQKVFLREGITPENQTITPRFVGSNNKSVLNRYLLRYLALADLPERVTWLNDPEIYTTVNIETPVLLENTERWFKSVKENASRFDFVMEKNNQIVAMAGLTNINDQQAEGYTFVHPDMKGKGLGTICHFLRAVYAFDFLGLHSIKTIIDHDNMPSIKVVKKVGYYADGEKENDVKVNGQIKDRIYYKCDRASFRRELFEFQIGSDGVVEILVGDK